MESTEKRVWGIHTRDDNLFLNNNVIAIGWAELGDLSKLAQDRESFRAAMAAALPDKPTQAIANMTGQVYRFACEMKIGDYVVFSSKEDRMINIGTIVGDYFFAPEAKGTLGDYVNRRKVKWLKNIPRTSFSQGALHESGAAMSVFLIKNYADEFLEALTGSPALKNPKDEDKTVAATAEQIQDDTRDFILKELSRLFKGYDMEPFIANLLSAMGYRAEVSPQGGDRGIDITAYKDELPPRIVVQVKSGDSSIKETTVQSLRGAMKEGDYGLFVTLTDFTDNARDFLEANPRIKGINGYDLVELILQYYEKLDEKYRDMIPLKKVFIPVAKEAQYDGK